MSSFLTSTDISYLTGVLNQHFDTFNRTITVHKEPKKSISNLNTNHYAGYDGQSVERNYTLTPVSASFPAVVVTHNKNKNDYNATSLNLSVPRNGARIKVKLDARDYIENGKTEMIVLDGKNYNLVTPDGTQNYLGLVYHIYNLEQTT